SRNTIGMHIRAAIYDCPPPRRVIDDDCVFTPSEVAVVPAPRDKSRSERNAETEPDGAADIEAAAGGGEHDQRIVVGDHDVIRIDRKDFNVWSDDDPDLGVRSKVAITHGLLAITLHGIHDVL